MTSAPTDDASLPVNTPEVFGAPTNLDSPFTVVDVVASAPSSDPEGHRPGVTRLLQGDGANIIVFTFTPGQYLTDHKAAHPITVQVVSGELDFTIGTQVHRLRPGTVIHLRERVPHRVDYPADAAGPAVLLLHMLTGERHD